MLRQKKVTRGRQKIDMRKIQNKDALYISFSKRRNGLFSKASDLSMLCDADLAVLVFSPTGRPHAFGSPGVDQIVDRFFSAGLISSAGSHAEQVYRKRTVQALNQEAAETSHRVEAEKARRAALAERLVAATQGIEWIHDLEGTGFRELDLLQELLQELKSRATAHAMKLQRGSVVASPSPSPLVSSHHAGHNWGSTETRATVDRRGFIMPSSNYPPPAQPQPPPQPQAQARAISYPASLLNPFEPASFQGYKINNPLADAIDYEDFLGTMNGM